MTAAHQQPTRARWFTRPRSGESVALWLLLAALLLLPVCATAQVLNLAPEAAYGVTISGHVYAGQVVPGTNTPAPAQGFRPAPPWQGSPRTLTDGRRDGDAVRTWFWSNMNKRVTVRFDLRRPARISGVRLWPAAGEPACERATARVADDEEGLREAAELVLQPADEGMAWSGEPVAGRYVEVVCEGGAPQMTLAEVELWGEPTGDFLADAPPAGLLPAPARDVAHLLRLPDRPEGTVNLARIPGVQVTVTSRHHDDMTGRWLDDTCAADSDPTGQALMDGDLTSAVRSFSGWYAAKRINVEVDLGRAARVDRVIVWSAGHDVGRSFVSYFRLWLQAGEGAPWTPAGEVWNPLLPGEAPAPQYPVVSPPIGGPATRLRLEIAGVAQSADVVEVAQIEVWGTAMEGPLTAATWRVRQPVPAIEPVALGELDEAYDWLQRERLRGLYGYVGQWRDGDLLERAVNAGFNCLIIHTMGATHSETGWPEEAAQWARVQEQRGLRVIISWPFGSDERYANTAFGGYQPGGAVRWLRGPCPLSREYWERVVGDRALVAAEAGLTGLVVDMEMYGADAVRYPGPCHCDTCWTQFVEDHLEGVAAEDVPLTDRPAWLSANGLAADYARRQELQVMAILSDIRGRVRAANPRFLLGNLLDPESLPGLARGLGTATMPALVFSELEYTGAVAGVAERVERLGREGYPVWYLAGLWIRPVTPPMLPELVAAPASSTGGYWIWSTAAFRPDARPPYAHAEGYSHDDYWQAFRRANDALDEALANGGGPRP